MHSSRIAAPLSPPTSPSMAGQFKNNNPQWQHAQHVPVPHFYHSNDTHARNKSLSPYHQLDAENRAALQSHLESSGPLTTESIFASSLEADPTKIEFGDARGAVITPDVLGEVSGRAMPNVTTQSSGPMSPSKLSPPLTSDDQALDDVDEADLDLEGEEDEKEQTEKPAMTAAEIRNQKRKMKRFRLTHNQTRYLMSEFSRQAHPDAAHRERLSRDIPGLSPRQVQVWFQNRRAKLKRLTVEDRERVMRSRALPENFDMTAPLQTQFSNSPPADTTAATPITRDVPAMQRPGGPIRSLTVDTLRRGMPDSRYISPTGMSAALGSLAFTPPHSATDNSSPSSTSGDLTSSYPSRTMMGSPINRMFPTKGSMTSTMGHSSIGRGMSMQDRFRRASGSDSVASPLRSSMSYSNFMNAQGMNPMKAQRDSLRDMPPPGGPYGLGFSYETMNSFPSGLHGHQMPPNTPPAVSMSQSTYRDNSAFPQYFEYQKAYNSPLLSPYSYSGAFTAPLPSQPFGHHMNGHSRILNTLPSQNPSYTHLNADLTAKDLHETDVEHTDSGVPISASY